MKVSATSLCRITIVISILLNMFPIAGSSTILDQIMQIQPFSGVVHVVEGEEVLLSYATGFSDRKKQTPIDRHTLFPIASITKVCTAFTIEAMLTKNLISSNQSVSSILRSVQWDPCLTIDHLLTHRSALIRDVTDLGFLSPYEYVDIGHLISMISSSPVIGKPGERYSYGNTNYQVLAYIGEVVTQKSYEFYIREQLFDKTGMSSSIVLSSEHPDFIALGYVDGFVSSMQLPSFDYSHMVGSGNIASNVVDLVSFVHTVTNKLQDNPRLRLSWKEGVLLQRPYLEHTGHLSSGYASIIRIYPEEDLYIIVLLNCLYSDIDQIADAVSACIWDKSPDVSAHTQHNLPSIVGRYMHASQNIPLVVEDRNGVLTIQYAADQLIFLQKIDDGIYRDPAHPLYLHLFSEDKSTGQIVYQIQGLVRGERFIKEL